MRNVPIFLLLGAGVAHGECTSPHTTIQAIADKDQRVLPPVSKLSPEIARKKFQKAYAPIDALVNSEGTFYSASKTLDRLWGLYGYARASGECSPELARLLSSVSIIEFKRQYPEQATVFAEAALTINPLSAPEDVTDAVLLHHYIAQGTQDPDVAIRHLQAAVQLEPRDPSLDRLQRFGLRQDLGFWMHEGKRFAEAREVNEQLLADAERVLGKDDVALLGVIENLAQNTYALNQLDASEAWLQRCRALAVKHANLEVESRMLFQLGVLAYEQGKIEDARRYMKSRVEHAQRNPGHGLLEPAVATRDELEERIYADSQKKPGAPATH